jgi:two-component system phosphate regulon sensor histidine kinase PhoR
MDSWWLVLGFGAITLALIWLWRREFIARLNLERDFRRHSKRLEDDVAKLEGERGLLGAAVSASGELLLVTDHDLNMKYINPCAENRFGSLPDQATLISYTRNLDLERLAIAALEGGEPEELERDIVIGNRSYLTRAVAFPGEVGLALTDVSEVQRLSRARQDMVANLSHELRTPITSLRLLADTLQSPTGKKPEIAQDLMSKITSEVDTLEQIAIEMLDLAAIESGRQVVRLAPVALMEVIADPVDRLRDQAVRGGVQLTVDIPSELRVLADKDQASRAVQNVLHNAIKLTPNQGEVLLKAHIEEDERVVLSIQDSGPGIHPDELERIFERFFRGDRARGTPGTGLGLAIARHILFAHGGTIWAENRPPPESGAVFNLSFQVA